MRKTLLTIEKTTSSNKPSTMGGLGKALGYIITGLAWLVALFQTTAIEFDAAVEPSVGVKKTYSDRYEKSLNSANAAIAKLEKGLVKVTARIAANDITTKPNKHQRLLDLLGAIESDLDRKMDLVKVLRKKLYK